MKNDGACLDPRLCKPKQRESICFRVCVYLLMIGVCGWWMVDVHTEIQRLEEYMEMRHEETKDMESKMLYDTCGKTGHIIDVESTGFCGGIPKCTGVYNTFFGHQRGYVAVSGYTQEENVGAGSYMGYNKMPAAKVLNTNIIRPRQSKEEECQK